MNAQSTEKTGAESPPGNGGGFRIVRLQAQNVKKLKAIDITPKPGAPLVIVAGNNGEGKTSVLDAIMWALGGADAVPKDPIRHGQTKAIATVDLGEFTATRTISAKGNSLEVRRKGIRQDQPQTILNDLLGRLTFDPLEFSRMKPAQRLETLLSLVDLSLNLTAHAAKRKEAFDRRTGVNQRKRDLTGELRELVEPDAELPTEPVNVGALVASKNQMQQVIDSNERIRREFTAEVSAADNLRVSIEKSKCDLEEQEKQLAVADDRIKTRRTGVERLETPDMATIDAQIADAHNLNTKIVRATDYAQKVQRLGAVTAEVDELSAEIQTLDEMKESTLAAAEFPVDGLSFADGDVSFNSILFDQLSSAEQLRVSLAMAMAMNPQLRVVRITDGSLLDETSLGIVRDMAQEKDYQVWIECVGNRADATVVIEDGEAVGHESN